ncbi:MAG TPA: hypothetical protein PKN33_07905 [Phycisphaerae bacterium]|nr:hypothetical protein [Phycisphaerae bacterium]
MNDGYLDFNPLEAVVRAEEAFELGDSHGCRQQLMELNRILSDLSPSQKKLQVVSNTLLFAHRRLAFVAVTREKASEHWNHVSQLLHRANLSEMPYLDVLTDYLAHLMADGRFQELARALEAHLGKTFKSFAASRPDDAPPPVGDEADLHGRFAITAARACLALNQVKCASRLLSFCKWLGPSLSCNVRDEIVLTSLNVQAAKEGSWLKAHPTVLQWNPADELLQLSRATILVWYAVDQIYKIGLCRSDNLLHDVPLAVFGIDASAWPPDQRTLLRGLRILKGLPCEDQTENDGFPSAAVRIFESFCICYTAWQKNRDFSGEFERLILVCLEASAANQQLPHQARVLGHFASFWRAGISLLRDTLDADRDHRPHPTAWDSAAYQSKAGTILAWAEENLSMFRPLIQIMRGGLSPSNGGGGRRRTVFDWRNKLPEMRPSGADGFEYPRSSTIAPHVGQFRRHETEGHCDAGVEKAQQLCRFAEHWDLSKALPSRGAVFLVAPDRDDLWCFLFTAGHDGSPSPLVGRRTAWRVPNGKNILYDAYADFDAIRRPVSCTDVQSLDEAVSRCAATVADCLAAVVEQLGASELAGRDVVLVCTDANLVGLPWSMLPLSQRRCRLIQHVASFTISPAVSVGALLAGVDPALTADDLNVAAYVVPRARGAAMSPLHWQPMIRALVDDGISVDLAGCQGTTLATVSALANYPADGECSVLLVAGHGDPHEGLALLDGAWRPQDPQHQIWRLATTSCAVIPACRLGEMYIDQGATGFTAGLLTQNLPRVLACPWVAYDTPLCAIIPEFINRVRSRLREGEQAVWARSLADVVRTGLDKPTEGSCGSVSLYDLANLLMFGAP